MSLKTLEKTDTASVDAILRSGRSSDTSFDDLVNEHISNAFNLRYGESGRRSTDKDVLLASTGLIEVLGKCLPSLVFLRALANTVKGTQKTDAPVVRKQAFLEFFRWFQNNGHIDSKCNPQLFAQAHDLIIKSLTDVWSNIRKACARALPKLFMACIDVGPENNSDSGGQAQTLYTSLRQFIAAGESADKSTGESSWQQKEGSLRGIGAVIGRFEKWGPTASKDKWQKKLPPALQVDIRRTILPMLSHVQLSVRDTAGEAFGQLAQRLPPHEMKATMLVMLEKLLSPRVLAGEANLVDATSSEGLLKVRCTTGMFEQF